MWQLLRKCPNQDCNARCHGDTCHVAPEVDCVAAAYILPVQRVEIARYFDTNVAVGKNFRLKQKLVVGLVSRHCVSLCLACPGQIHAIVRPHGRQLWACYIALFSSRPPRKRETGSYQPSDGPRPYELLERFERRKVSLVSVAESSDTGSAVSRLVINIMTAVSQWSGRRAVSRVTH